MKKLVYKACLIGGFLMPFGLTVEPAAAHVLLQDNGIAAELHIPPEDHPVAGQPTKLEFSFGDTKDVFKLQDCLCQLTITQGNQPIRSLPLLPASGQPLDSTPTISFPKPGGYTLTVSGAAKDGAFVSFRLAYPVQVASMPTPAQTVADRRGNILWPAVIVGGAMFLIAGTALRYRRHTNR